MLPQDILLNILSELDPVLYYKCLSVSKKFHVDSVKANDIYLRNKYSKHTLVDLVYKGDVDGIKYRLSNDESVESLNLAIKIDKNISENVIKIVKLLSINNDCQIYIGVQPILLPSSIPTKVRNVSAKSRPSGFAKPVGLSPELCKFLRVSDDTKLARTEVTKKIFRYVKKNGLQHPGNKRIILPDNKLGALLNVPDKETLTVFDLYRYMKVHFRR